MFSCDNLKVNAMKEIGVNGLTIKDFNGAGLSITDTGCLFFELAKIDLSFATFAGVHFSLGLASIDLLGSEEQRKRFVPGCMNCDKICAFGLTEPDYGSDASSLKTTAKKVEGGYLLNG